MPGLDDKGSNRNLESYMPSKNASDLVRRWNVPIDPAPGAVLYCAAGNWYHPLKHFPGALLDSDGYVVFATEAEFRACPQIKIGPKGDVGVTRGIRHIDGYVRGAVSDL